MPRDVVPIFRSPRRASASSRVAMVREDDVRFLADEQAAGDVDAQPRQLVHFGKQRDRIDDDAVADGTDDAGMQDAGRNQMQHELLAADVDGVPGVVSALVAANDRKVRREEIDDLAFAFIAPLGAEHAQVHARDMIPCPDD
jgi:hypothetical protein